VADDSVKLSRRLAIAMLRHRAIILECENVKPIPEKYHGQTMYDGQEMMGAELLAIEQMAELFERVIKNHRAGEKGGAT
jgi:hypothetical protein